MVSPLVALQGGEGDENQGGPEQGNRPARQYYRGFRPRFRPRFVSDEPFFLFQKLHFRTCPKGRGASGIKTSFYTAGVHLVPDR